MIATPLTTPGAPHSNNDLPWLHAAANHNDWLHRLAKPDHFSHSTAGPQRAATPAVASSVGSSATPKLTLKLPEHAARRWPSARSEAQPWDAAWLAQDDASDYSDEEEDDLDGSTTPTLPTLRRQSASDARVGKTVRIAPLRPAVLDLMPAAQAAYMLPHQASQASSSSDAQFNARTSQSVPASPTAARRRRRHQRAISAPGQPGLAPLSAAPLHVDTALPLALPPRSVFAAAPREDTVCIDASMLAQASSAALQRSSSVASMGSDGSWHGDVGDEDPDAQLEAANARVASASSSRRQSVSQAIAAFSASPVSTKQRTFSFSSVSGSSDDEEGSAISACAGPLASALANLLDLSVLGVTTPRAKRTRPSRGRALTEPHKAPTAPPLSMVDRRSSSSDGQRYTYSTPASLRAEGKGLRYHRQAPQPNALTRLGSWLVGAEAAEPESPRLQRRRSRMASAASDDSVPPSPSTSMLLLPSMLSRSSSVASLGSLATLPALTHDASSDSSDSEDGEEDSEALTDAARVRTAWKVHGGQPGAGALKIATSHRRPTPVKRRHAPAGLSFTPLNGHSAQEMRQPAPVSPLWCEDAEDDEPTSLPYSRSWVSLLGL